MSFRIKEIHKKVYVCLVEIRKLILIVWNLRLLDIRLRPRLLIIGFYRKDLRIDTDIMFLIFFSFLSFYVIDSNLMRFHFYFFTLVQVRIHNIQGSRKEGPNLYKESVTFLVNFDWNSYSSFSTDLLRGFLSFVAVFLSRNTEIVVALDIYFLTRQ